MRCGCTLYQVRVNNLGCTIPWALSWLGKGRIVHVQSLIGLVFVSTSWLDSNGGLVRPSGFPRKDLQ